jgi:hypothetical protein
MALPRFIEIDGRRFLWRDLVALRCAHRDNARLLRRGRVSLLTNRPASVTPRSARHRAVLSAYW